MTGSNANTAAAAKCTDERPHLAKSIANQLRQESWFGCCRCGSPLVEFHHILGWKQTLNDPEHMLALCPTCHALADAKALDETDQRRMKANSFNKIRNLASGQLYTSRDVIIVDLGRNYMIGADYRITAGDETLFSARIGERNELLLTLAIYDEHDELLMHIVDNEWILGPELVTNLIFKPRTLRIESPRLLKPFEIDASRDMLQLRGALTRRGMHIDLGKSAVTFPANRMMIRGFVFVDCGIALTPTGAILSVPSAGEEGSTLMVDPDPSKPFFANYLKVLYEAEKDRKRQQ